MSISNIDIDKHLEGFRPLLAGAIEHVTELRKLEKGYPYLASPKLDGIRVILHPTLGAVTRTLKPLPNDYIRDCLKINLGIWPELRGFDGEITLGPPEDACTPNIFNRTQSAVMAYGGCPKVTFHVFDRCIDHQDAYSTRYTKVQGILTTIGDMNQFQAKRPAPVIRLLEHRWIHTQDELLEYRDECLQAGFEGIMLRHPDRPYKFGRSSISANGKSQHLIKFKEAYEMATAELLVEDFAELMSNQNEATADAFGLTKRSSHQENKVPANTLGKIVGTVVNGPFTGQKLKVGTGFTAADRDEIWAMRNELRGRYITFKYQISGAKEKPRFPSYQHFRASEDVINELEQING